MIDELRDVGNEVVSCWVNNNSIKYILFIKNITNNTSLLSNNFCYKKILRIVEISTPYTTVNVILPPNIKYISPFFNTLRSIYSTWNLYYICILYIHIYIYWCKHIHIYTCHFSLNTNHFFFSFKMTFRFCFLYTLVEYCKLPSIYSFFPIYHTSLSTPFFSTLYKIVDSHVLFGRRQTILLNLYTITQGRKNNFLLVTMKEELSVNILTVLQFYFYMQSFFLFI